MIDLLNKLRDNGSAECLEAATVIERMISERHLIDKSLDAARIRCQDQIRMVKTMADALEALKWEMMK